MRKALNPLRLKAFFICLCNENQTVLTLLNPQDLYIINFEEIAYHQDVVLYIIIAKVYAPTVMIYAFGDDIHAEA